LVGVPAEAALRQTQNLDSVTFAKFQWQLWQWAAHQAGGSARIKLPDPRCFRM